MSTEQRSLSPRAWAELFLLAAIWGASFLAIRIALDEIPVVVLVLHRTGWAMLALWLVVLLRGAAMPRDLRSWLAFAVMGLLNNVIPFALMGWGQLHVPTGMTSILNAFTAVFGVLVAALLFADERLTPRRLGGVALGFAGVALAIGPDALTGFNPASLGQLAILGGTLSYALAGAWARKRMGGFSALVSATGMLTASTAMLLPAVLLMDVPLALPRLPATWGAIAYFSLIATAGAYLLYYRVLTMAGSGNLLLVTLLIPPVAIALGTLVRDERLSPLAFAGFALLAAGLGLLNSHRRRRAD